MWINNVFKKITFGEPSLFIKWELQIFGIKIINFI